MHGRYGGWVMQDAPQVEQSDTAAAEPWRRPAPRPYAPVPLGTAAIWIVRIVCGFVIAIWAVLGFLLWVPLLTRMIFVFTATVVTSMYTGHDPTHARHALEAAMSFYSRGFALIFDSMQGDLQKHGPFIIPESAHMARMLWELIFSVLFWLGIIGTYWLMGSSIWGRVGALFSR